MTGRDRADTASDGASGATPGRREATRIRTAARRAGPGRWIVAASACVLAGCMADGRPVTSDGRPMPPKPRSAPETPTGAALTRMTLLVPGKADDSDGNGYPDQFRVATALFAEPHPTPIHVDGTFVFTLYRFGEARVTAAKPIAEWRFGPDIVRAARTRDLYGPSHQFTFSLLSVGGDRLPAQRGDLRGRFEPADGSGAVQCSDEPRPVMFGRGSAGAS
ncbi:MAG: hypothetical protein KF817_07520 [Phycisphaeraceae bacterium]|nr:hypothetical protein [Phycisphaeraceae bacterium]